MATSGLRTIDKDAVNRVARQTIEALTSRKTGRLSQQAIAVELDWRPSTLSRYMKGGKPSASNSEANPKDVVSTISAEAFIRLLALAGMNFASIETLNNANLTFKELHDKKIQRQNRTIADVEKKALDEDGQAYLRTIVSDLIDATGIRELEKKIGEATSEATKIIVSEHNRAFYDFVEGRELLDLERCCSRVYIANEQMEMCLQDRTGFFCRTEAENIYAENRETYYYWIVPEQVGTMAVYEEALKSFMENPWIIPPSHEYVRSQSSRPEEAPTNELSGGGQASWTSDVLTDAYCKLLFEVLFQEDKFIDRTQFINLFSKRVRIHPASPFPFGSFAFHAFDADLLRERNEELWMRITGADGGESFAYILDGNLGLGDIISDGAATWCCHLQLRLDQHGWQQLMQEKVASRAMRLFQYLFSPKIR